MASSAGEGVLQCVRHCWQMHWVVQSFAIHYIFTLFFVCIKFLLFTILTFFHHGVRENCDYRKGKKCSSRLVMKASQMWLWYVGAVAAAAEVVVAGVATRPWRWQKKSCVQAKCTLLQHHKTGPNCANGRICRCRNDTQACFVLCVVYAHLFRRCL